MDTAKQPVGHLEMIGEEDTPPQLPANFLRDEPRLSAPRDTVSASRAAGSASSLRSQGPSSQSSRAGESRSFLPGVPELREMALLDVNTEAQDVVKAHLRFRRRKDEASESKSSMPCMKKMVVPAEWPNLKAKVAEFADKAFWTPTLPPQDLKLTLPIHFPDDRLVLAKQVYLKSITGEESGSKVWIGLTSFSAIEPAARGSRASSLHDIREGGQAPVAQAAQANPEVSPEDSPPVSGQSMAEASKNTESGESNSGGPVLGAHGLVVGMACSHLKNASNIGYIIPSQVLEQFISCIGGVAQLVLPVMFVSR
eukprot:s453_g20.t1